MEVLLNTTWLLLAIAAFFFWQFGVEGIPWRRVRSRRHRFICLTVALILLFPVISLTDDLHAEQAAVEDSSRSIMKARNTLQGCVRAGGAPFVASVAQAPDPAAALPICLDKVTRVERLLRSPARSSSHDGRSPPFRA